MSGYYTATSTLIALGAKDRICGIEADDDKQNIYHLVAPEFLELPNVGGIRNLDIEECASLYLDLILKPSQSRSTAGTAESGQRDL